MHDVKRNAWGWQGWKREGAGFVLTIGITVLILGIIGLAGMSHQGVSEAPVVWLGRLVLLIEGCGTYGLCY